MDIKTLQKAIHDLAMAVRAGDWSKWDKLQELRKEHRKRMGVPEAEEAPKPAAPQEAPAEAEAPKEAEPTEDKPKKKKKDKES